MNKRTLREYCVTLLLPQTLQIVYFIPFGIPVNSKPMYIAVLETYFWKYSKNNIFSKHYISFT